VGGAALIAYLGQRYLRMVPLVGFLLTGVVLGPHALGVVRDLEVVEGAAEVGVILLLFTIGIEFSLERLARIRRLIFGAGGLQVGLTTALIAAVVLVAGGSWRAAVFTGFLASLSSTVIVLKLLSDRGKAGTMLGQTSLAVLLFQDLAVVLMVLLVPVLAGGALSGGAILLVLAKALAIVGLVLVAARRVMPPFLERVARTCEPDIFLLTIIGICFLTAWLTSLAGVSVSLGAFLAGLVVSESRFSHHAFSEVLPLRTLFSALFFVSIGMLLDPGFVVAHPLNVLVVVIGVAVLKVGATTLSLRLVGVPLGVAGACGVLLAQVGEFTFVLERAGRELGLYPGGTADGSQAFIAATVVLMASTPLLARVAWRSARREPSDVTRADEAQPSRERLRDHVVVAGYGPHARGIVRVLRAANVAHVVATLSPGGATEASADGTTVLLGDYTRRAILEALGVDAARVFVVADDEFDVTSRAVAGARLMAENLIIVAVARTEREATELRAAGADHVIAVQASVQRALLHHILIAAHGGDEASAPAWRAEEREDDMARGCTHLDQVRAVRPRTPGVCEDCVRSGSRWVHLRLCMTCGHVGCCDSSPNRHARQHYHETNHPIVQSAEPGEDWGWCFVDQIEVTLTPAPH
jgi:CPA2 family monovalent cation:H+ antiporter-2